MIIWVSSYPRSGNTFFLILLHTFSGLPVYYVHGTSHEKGNKISIGYEPLPSSLQVMNDSSKIFFVKTHEPPSDQSPAIYLVRDGRDSIVSYAHFIFDNAPEHLCGRNFEQVLTDLNTCSDYYGGWSNHVLAWTQRTAPTVILRFEYLVQHRNPCEIIRYIFETLKIQHSLFNDQVISPSFKFLHQQEPKLFRSGKIGQWKTEMSPETQKQFWRHHGYAMQKLGYSQHSPFLSIGVEFFQNFNLAQQKGELVSTPQEGKLISLQTELQEKEATIQNMAFFLNLSPSYWLSVHLRPLLKKTLPTKIVAYVRRSINPLSLEPQFKPRSIRLPHSYYCASQPVLSDRMPWISIVTPSYNQVQYISQTIDSILQQNYPHLEYVIQDGGSNDGTAQILDHYAQQVSHIQSAPDAGQAHAINMGFQKTQGQIMAWLNADDILLPGTLHYVAAFFRNNPDVDVVYGHRILINERGEEFSRWILPPHDNEILSWADYIPQETLFWRRELWNQVGGKLDQSYRFAMDWELLLRFRAAGARFVRLPRFLGAFRVHTQQKTQALYDVGEEEMNRLRWTQHGETVSSFKVGQKVNQYLRRANWYRFLYQIKILRY